MKRDEVVFKRELVEALERILFEFILFTPVDKSPHHNDIILDTKTLLMKAKYEYSKEEKRGSYVN